MPKWNPHQYQKKAIKFGLNTLASALWLSPGLGKTTITMAIYKMLKLQKQTIGALVIAPLRVCHSTWPQQAAYWDDFKHLKVQILHGPDKAKNLRESADLYLINPEGLEWLFSELARMRVWPFDFLIIDESTKFKSPSSSRFKLLKSQRKRFKRCLELTGSPAPNGMLDIWSQIYLLDEGASLGRYITHFKDRYFFKTGFGGFVHVLRKGADEEIYKAISHMVLRMDAEDYLDMPPLINNTIQVELPPKAFKQYKDFENNFLLVLGGATVVAPSAASLQNRCMQAANGAVYIDGKQWEPLHDAKLDALEDLVEELSGTPAMVAYWFNHDLERLQQRFPKTPYIGSGVSTKKALELERQWNAGELPLLFVQPASVSHGLNLQDVPGAVVIFSLFWDLEAYEQLIRRLWRQGQKSRVMVHHLVARGTVDEDVMAGLNSKDKNQKAILEAMRKRTSS